MDIQQYFVDNQDKLDVDFINATLDKKIEWLNFLKESAAIDLSLGHIIQHNHTARLTIELVSPDLTKEYLHAHPYSQLFGTSSVIKLDDTCQIDNNTLSGEKLFVSGIDRAGYHVFWMNHNNKQQIAFVKDHANGVSHNMNYVPIGMEGTTTGHLVFDNVTDFQLLTTTADERLAKRLFFHNIGFNTVNLGLCRALLVDLFLFVESKNIPFEFETKALTHSLNVYADLWESNLYCLQTNGFDNYQLKKIATTYSEGKRVLMSIIEKYLMLGDSRYTQYGIDSQRFRDALIYVSHRTNFYNSLSTVYKQGK